MSVVAAAVIGSAVVGGMVSSDNADKQADAMRDAAQMDPAQRTAIQSQTRIAEAQWAHTQAMDQYNMNRQNSIDAQNQRAQEAMMANQQKLDGRADEQYNYYMQNGRPMIDRMMGDATSWDSAGELARLRGQASADVEQNFAQQRNSAIRTMGRYGVNPGSGRFMASLATGGTDAALAKVNAANQLTEGRRAQGVQLRQQAANVANGFPAQSLSSTGAANSSGGGAASIGQMGMASALGVQGAYNGGSNAAGAMFGSSASGLGAIRGHNIGMYNTQVASNAANAQGWGQLAGAGIGAYGRSGGFNFSGFGLSGTGATSATPYSSGYTNADLSSNGAFTADTAMGLDAWG
jgi:hypothetical protein